MDSRTIGGEDGVSSVYSIELLNGIMTTLITGSPPEEATEAEDESDTVAFGEAHGAE